VFIGFISHSSRFFQWLCLGFSKIFLGLMAGVWMDGFSWYLMTILHFVWVVHLPELMKYFAFLSAIWWRKLELSSQFWCGWSFFIKRD
jgi:hypothetical protein